MGNLLKNSDESFTNQMFGAREDDILAPSAKKAKYDKDDENRERENAEERETVGWFREKLGFVLLRKLRDQRWEVRDSVLELVFVLVEIRRGASFLFAQTFLFFSLHSIITGRLDVSGYWGLFRCLCDDTP